MKILWFLLLASQTILTIDPLDLQEPDATLYPIHWLAFCGRHALITGLVESGDYHVDQSDHLGRTPLHYAALSGNIAAINKLLLLGAEVDVKDHKQLSPEYFALIHGKIGAYERLKYHRDFTEARRLFADSPTDSE